MTAEILDGKALAKEMREEIRVETEALAKSGTRPGLAVLLVGEDPASVSYVRGKERALQEAGMHERDHRLPADVSEERLLALIREINDDPRIHGILVQLPLPDQIDSERVVAAIDPDKDVDGFHPVNLGRMVRGLDCFYPCTPHGVVKIMERAGIGIAGKEVVIVGRSNLVGRPLSIMLSQKSDQGNATVTVCHSRTRNLVEHTRRAEILIAAAGAPKMITSEMISEGTVVIDVGVNRVEDPEAKKGYRLVGDVDYDGALEKASYITPVPGGVGPMTITMLLYNTLLSAKRKASGG
ncbi:MAG: bifunctional methylenetetrahydrofolate dehydrogenase/methenyltetrahydrofolate cyclohydrolase FolD [Alkalispirochaetaceae bacterium]